MASALVESAMQAAGKADYEVLGTLKGSELEYMKTAHPFLDRTSLVIVGDHVTLESGTGCVHTAPGHGVEDYDVCHNHYPEIPVVVPVDSHGRMTAEAGDFVAGLTTDEANKVIAARLEETGNLFALQKIIHQYPHCWRCKTPVLFRATEIVDGEGGTHTDEALGLSVLVEKASGEKCMRCWCYSDTVGTDPAHPDLCERCAKVLS